ncbi:hypothetical protein F6X56_13865 [Rhodococcus erythropolis]|uniref:PP_RS20740 family protein n=1 Tax=Rhodococcus erythropolis TaxID=1833 RepID=UPI001244522E|nr:hypothetical protein [Rhodococcus erythropolis]MBY6385364.1 hypothetical protein [Rhodococcus erythropolis]QEX10723.1 hypothetical protein F6X56_13865 [Rhodococcus erythropolis]
MSVSEIGNEEFPEYGGPSRPARQNFEAWHRPRKQYVREKQWGNCIIDCLSEWDGKNPIRYFGLPGVDLTDIRYLVQSVCKVHNRKLYFLGMEAAAHPGSDLRARLEIGLHEVKGEKSVDSSSDVVIDSLESLGNDNSKAWSTVRAGEPFDILNIDLCDGVLKRSSDSSPTIYNALHQLMGFQSKRTKPWLLFLTTVLDEESVDKEVLEKLLERLEEASSSCANIVDWSVGNSSLPIWNRWSEWTDDEHSLTSTSASIYNWLVLNANSSTQHKANLRAAFAYKTTESAVNHNMISLAIRFKPFGSVSAQDPAGLSQLSPDPPIDMCATLEQFFSKFRSRTDLDDKMIQDSDLKTKMENNLMSLFSWDESERGNYLNWVKGFRS